MSRLSEIEEISERVWLLNQVNAPWLNFLMDTKQLSKNATLLLALVIFDGYELFPAHGPADKRRDSDRPAKS